MTTYDEYEASIEGGAPWEAYDIYTDMGEHWRHTTAGETIELPSGDYEPALVDREKIVLSGTSQDGDVVIKLWREHPLVSRLAVGPIEGVIHINVYRGHADQYQLYRELDVLYVKWDKKGVPSFQCVSGTSSQVRQGHRRMHQRICDHVLYSTGPFGCNVAKALYTVAGTLDSVNGIILVSTTFATKTDGWFARGSIIIGYAQRMITYHVGNTIKVDRIIPDAVMGSSFSASAGCDHLPTTCLTKFSNKSNYGGNEFAPVDNVFEIGVGF